jgi:MerR family copper efflux transcriptional regulator
MTAAQYDEAICECQGAPAVPDQMTIGQLAQMAGIGAKTIRYYEAIGLLPRPPRRANGYRRYGLADLNRLYLLRRIRILGVPLSVAKPLLAGATDARCADVQHELLTLVQQRLQALDREIAELHQLRAAVEGYRRALEACPPDATNQSFSTCPEMRCLTLPVLDEQDQEVIHASV